MSDHTETFNKLLRDITSFQLTYGDSDIDNNSIYFPRTKQFVDTQVKKVNQTIKDIIDRFDKSPHEILLVKLKKEIAKETSQSDIPSILNADSNIDDRFSGNYVSFADTDSMIGKITSMNEIIKVTDPDDLDHSNTELAIVKPSDTELAIVKPSDTDPSDTELAIVKPADTELAIVKPSDIEPDYKHFTNFGMRFNLDILDNEEPLKFECTSEHSNSCEMSWYDTTVSNSPVHSKLAHIPDDYEFVDFATIN